MYFEICKEKKRKKNKTQSNLAGRIGPPRPNSRPPPPANPSRRYPWFPLPAARLLPPLSPQSLSPPLASLSPGATPEPPDAPVSPTPCALRSDHRAPSTQRGDSNQPRALHASRPSDPSRARCRPRPSSSPPAPRRPACRTEAEPRPSLHAARARLPKPAPCSNPSPTAPCMPEATTA